MDLLILMSFHLIKILLHRNCCFLYIIISTSILSIVSFFILCIVKPIKFQIEYSYQQMLIKSILIKNNFVSKDNLFLHDFVPLIISFKLLSRYYGDNRMKLPIYFHLLIKPKLFNRLCEIVVTYAGSASPFV